MRHGLRISLTVFLCLSGSAEAMGKGNRGGRPDPMTCPADIPAALAEHCPCDGQKNHGQYVRCVVQFRNALRKAGCLDALAKRTIGRCAARSTCGKPSAVLCCLSNGGTCNDPMPGNLVAEGSCSNDSALTCDVDADCTKVRARVASDEAACTVAGGIPGGSGSICVACTTTTSTTTTTTLP
ncbi:MAG: hypothetical protein ACREQL_10315 [Candidatus Binatia bacterium]